MEEKVDGEFLKTTIKEIQQKPWDEFFAAGDKTTCSRHEYAPIFHGKPGEGDGDFDPKDLLLS
jgi:hypothetical protein